MSRLLHTSRSCGEATHSGQRISLRLYFSNVLSERAQELHQNNGGQQTRTLVTSRGHLNVILARPAIASRLARWTRKFPLTSTTRRQADYSLYSEQPTHIVDHPNLVVHPNLLQQHHVSTPAFPLDRDRVLWSACAAQEDSTGRVDEDGSESDCEHKGSVDERDECSWEGA